MNETFLSYRQKNNTNKARKHSPNSQNNSTSIEKNFKKVQVRFALKE